MAELKTKETRASVSAFLAAIEDPEQRADARRIARLMREATGCRARLWGTSIVGFDRYHFRYASGREGDWPIVGFSPRKRELSVYLMSGFGGQAKRLARLGRHRKGKSCLYIRRLSDVDPDVLRELVVASVAAMRRKYPRG